jgi:ABC-type uncharacterized transport system permease subunit
LNRWLLPVLVVLCAGALAAIVALSGVSPAAVFTAGLRGAFGDARGLGATLTRTTPLLLSGLGVAVGLRAGLFNIGVEGQLLVGALAAAACGILLAGLHPALLLPACLVAGAAAGFLWAFPAGVLKVWRGGHEVITTIMLNYVARSLTKYIVANPLHDPASEMATSVYVGTGARMPSFGGDLSISTGLLFGVACAVGLMWWMQRSAAGFELRATGANPEAAAAAGVNVNKTIVWSMAVSGAFAGLAGAVQVCAYEYRFYDGISPGYGFDSLAVALIALANPLAVVVSSALFGALAQGAQFAQVATDIPKEIAAVVQGVVILVAAAAGWQRLRRSD